MIAVLEGPDFSGKTTLWNRMRRTGCLDAVYVPANRTDPALFPLLPLVERRQLELWGAVYDKSKLYVCDRGPWVSGPVYDALHGRDSSPYAQLLPRWAPEVRVLYLRCPMEELRRRAAVRGEDPLFSCELLERTAELYHAQLQRWTFKDLDAAAPEEKLCFRAAELLAQWRFA